MSIYETKEAKRVIAAGHDAARRELEMTPRHKLDKGNPNHPDYDDKLFGYPVDEFMAKQYK